MYSTAQPTGQLNMFQFTQYAYSQYMLGGKCPRGVVVKAIVGGIIVSEFVLQSCYYIHFRINTLGKGMNLLILPGMSQIVQQLFF